MDVLKFTARFHEMETREGLFNLQDRYGTYYWDIIRYEINHILYNVCMIKSQTINDYDTLKCINLVKYCCLLVLKLISFIKLWLLVAINKPKYLFFGCSRTIKNNNHVDIICGDLYRIFKKESIFIESYGLAKVPFFSRQLYLKRLIYKSLKLKCKVYTDDNYVILNEAIKKYFAIEFNFNKVLNNLLYKYYKDQKFYLNLLSIVKPKSVIIFQNGIQKGLFKAGAQLGISIIEMQHGIVDYTHIAYSYPLNSTNFYLPKYFLTFSEFWNTKIHYPVKQIISVGNDAYYIEKCSQSGPRFNSILIISGVLHHKNLSDMAHELLGLSHAIKVVLKLHPAQIRVINEVREDFKQYHNIEIVGNEISLRQCLSQSKFVLGIKSTGFYEALQAGNYVFILKKQDYLAHLDIFNKNKVYLINSAQEILKRIENINQCQLKEDTNPIFFEKFNQQYACQILKMA